MTEAVRPPQYIGKADVRTMPKNEVHPKELLSKETQQSPEQRQFFDRYQQESQKAFAAEKQANQHARDRMQKLDAPAIRKLGAKQLLWGWGLNFINIGGAFLGAAGGYLGTALAVGAVFGSGGWVPLAGMAAGIAVGTVTGAGGSVIGAELVRGIYEKVVRKFDKSLPQIDENDRKLGDLLSIVVGWNPPMVAGARNLFEGYNNMKSIQ